MWMFEPSDCLTLAIAENCAVRPLLLPDGSRQQELINKHVAEYTRVRRKGAEGKAAGWWCSAWLCQSYFKESQGEASVHGETVDFVQMTARAHTTTATGATVSPALILSIFSTCPPTKTCCVPSSNLRMEHAQGYWISKTEARPEGWLPWSTVSAHNRWCKQDVQPARLTSGWAR